MVQYLAIVGAFILGQTLDVIIQRPIEHLIDKVDDDLKISENARLLAIEGGKASQEVITNVGIAHKQLVKDMTKKLKDSKKMYCYEIDLKGNIYKISFQEYQDNFKNKDKFFDNWQEYKKFLMKKDNKNLLNYKDSKYLILENNSKINKDIKYLIFSFKLSERYIKEILELKAQLNKIK